jgi:SAM-dependent methyltransferase
MAGADASTERWQGASYAAQATHHRSLDEWFLSRHRPSPTDVVVDAGCGTGEFTQRLADLVPDGRAVGVEPDPSMLAVAREKARGNLDFREGRIEELDRVCGAESADFVVSRAVFHWLPLSLYPACYAAVHRVLRPGGWFHAESGGPGNVARVIEVLDEIADRHGLPHASVTFPDPRVALELLEDAGFAIPDGGVHAVAQRRAFDRDALLGFLRTQASLAWVDGAAAGVRDAFLADVAERVDTLRRADGSYDQTFVRLDVLGQKPV